MASSGSEGHPQILRPLVHYPSSMWGDHFLSISFDNSIFDAYAKQVSALKEEVRDMLLNSASDNKEKKINLINSMDRLGVSYHFEKEIEDELKKIFHSYTLDDKIEYDLDMISTEFRILRQHGYEISCDVFRRFLDNNNGKFKDTVTSDARGMLSLYEAAQLSLRGEDLLDEALALTTAHLELMAANPSHPLAKHAIQALHRPFHKGMSRVEARLYISTYEQDKSRNELLLMFAKFDFNLLQLKHQQELRHISKWWKDLNLVSRLPYARNRVVECYFWAVGVFFEPQYTYIRKILTKIITIASIIDDTYDAYGLIDELRIFTHAVDRWDANVMDELPDYMKVPYKMLLNIYGELADQMNKDGRSNSILHAKEAMKELVRSYHAEAEWLNERYVPTFDEYMQISLISSGYPMIATTCVIGLMTQCGAAAAIVDDDYEEVFQWIKTNPKIVTAASTICRLQDDIVSSAAERKRAHVATSIECYKKQHGVSEEEGISELKDIVANAWKDINEECLIIRANNNNNNNTGASRNLLIRFLNMARVIDVIYRYEDGYSTNSATMKEYITSLFVDRVII